MTESPMIKQIMSIPALIRSVVPVFTENIRRDLDEKTIHSTDHIYLTGCGDSHHVAVGSQLAFRLFTHIETEALTSMQFARYISDTMINPAQCMVFGASVSGEVSRTLEGFLLARKAGARVAAVTATPTSRIGKAAHIIIDSTQPPFSDPEGMIVPGMRSYIANLVSFYLIAIHIGEVKGFITLNIADELRSTLSHMGDVAETVIRNNEALAFQTAEEWKQAEDLVFLGSGPNMASALFSAAKFLEATGDAAIGQDLEEWAHLQYFAKETDTPTIIISAGDRDQSRAVEVITAAKAIGRRVALIGPNKLGKALTDSVTHFAIPDEVPEIFSPLVSVLPGSLVAAYKAEITHEEYFRGFGGGRSQEGGGGISRIRTSETLGLEELK